MPVHIVLEKKTQSNSCLEDDLVSRGHVNHH
jgi:hypothetical protein